MFRSAAGYRMSSRHTYVVHAEQFILQIITLLLVGLKKVGINRIPVNFHPLSPVLIKYDRYPVSLKLPSAQNCQVIERLSPPSWLCEHAEAGIIAETRVSVRSRSHAVKRNIARFFTLRSWRFTRSTTRGSGGTNSIFAETVGRRQVTSSV